MPRSPREVADLVRRMVAGEEDVVFADLFAADGVLTYPFAAPGQPPELHGQDAIRAFFGALGQAREMFEMAGIEATTWETDDPEVVVTEITHHGWSHATEAPYRVTALGVIRVREGEIVRYDDYMDPIVLARLLGRSGELAEALAQA
jgi:uncharacterized protein